MYEFFLLVFTIIIAEFGDKTQLVILSVASKTKEKMDVFWGAFIAFIIIDGLSIFFGAILSNIIPKKLLIGISGIIFLIYGALNFIFPHGDTRDITEDKRYKIIFSVFIMIALAELGDKSQIASIFLGATYPAFIVFLTIILILSVMTLITIYLSYLLFETLSSKTVHYISGVMFLAMGIFTILLALS